jgi:hypothetical protein
LNQFHKSFTVPFTLVSAGTTRLALKQNHVAGTSKPLPHFWIDQLCNNRVDIPCLPTGGAGRTSRFARIKPLTKCNVTVAALHAFSDTPL